VGSEGPASIDRGRQFLGKGGSSLGATSRFSATRKPLPSAQPIRPTRPVHQNCERAEIRKKKRENTKGKVRRISGNNGGNRLVWNGGLVCARVGCLPSTDCTTGKEKSHRKGREGKGGKLEGGRRSFFLGSQRSAKREKGRVFRAARREERNSAVGGSLCDSFE